VWSVFLITIAAATTLYYYLKKQETNWWQPLAMGSILFNIIFFSLLFPILDKSGSVSKLSPLISDAEKVVGYSKINDAFVFYHGKPIPVLPDAGQVRTIIGENPNTLVLQLGKKADLTDSLPELELLHDEKDLFSSQHTFIYKKKQDP
jgi:hypothetical protein